MPYKTDRLADLFPDAFAASERESVLHKILDAVGAELMSADEKIKRLLKSHWVAYAEGSALDGLGAIYGVARRTLRSGQPESDEAFRLRLQSTVPQFTGGGTVDAVKGAVRSALGLPFNLDQLKLPPEFQALRDDIDNLVRVREFSPKGDRVVETGGAAVALDARSSATEMVVSVSATTVAESLPRIEWTFIRGGGTRLSVVRLDSGQGFRSVGALTVAPGGTIVFTAGVGNRLSAVADGVELGGSFTNLDGTTPALMPPVPAAASQWRFRAQSGLFDVASFGDGSTFDLPRMQVAIERVVYEPLTFDVEVPFFLQQAVADLKKIYGYPGDIFVFEGIPLDRIQQVVDQTRAAGVRGSVQFFLTFLERHEQGELFRSDAAFALTEALDVGESLLVANTSDQSEVQEMADQLVLGGAFDMSRFDGSFGFL